METREWLLKTHGPVCAYCERKIKKDLITLDHVTPLATQPATTDYIGRYRRGRGNPVEVRAAEGRLLVGDGETAQPILFYAPDLAFASNGPNKGTNHEFIRDNGQVKWMRVAGQIARKE